MSAPEPAPRRFTRRGAAAAAGLLLVHVILGGTSLARSGIAFDEPAHLVGGFASLTTGDHRLAENSQLPARWAAWPLAASGSLAPPSADDPAWLGGDPYQVAFRLFGSRSERDAWFQWGRSMILLLSVALGLLVLRIGFVLHGQAGALLGLALHAFSPTLLAHATLVTADLAAALLLLASTWTTWRLLQRVTLTRLLLGALSVSLLFVTKASAIALLPVAAVLVVLRLVRGEAWTAEWKGRERSLRRAPALAVLAGLFAFHVGAAVLTAWAAYGFRAEATSDPAARGAWLEDLDRTLEEAGTGGRVLRVVSDAHLLPEAFVHGYAHVRRHVERPSYLLGRASTDGDLRFFPYVAFVKTSLGELALLLLAVAAGLSAVRRRGGLRNALRRGFGDAAPMWALLLVYSGLAMAAGLSIGHRHLLPVYPAAFVLAGSAAAWLQGPRRLVRLLPIAALALLALESVVAWPHYLGYFNPLHGGSRNAWRHVVDSSLDWGQGLPRLADWLETEQPSGPVYLSYFGTDDPFLRGIEAIELHSYHPWSYRHGRARGFRLGPGLYVLSATMHRGLYTRPFPAWSRPEEEEYRRLRAIVDEAFDPATPPERAGALTSDPAWRDRYLELHERRLVRLNHWLRQTRPEPDALPAPSYLAWQLSEEDVRAALHGPPPFELRRE